MAKTDNLQDYLKDLADTIRAKKGTTSPINAQNFSAEIESISGGGSSDAPFITIDATSASTGTLTDEQLATLSADNAYIKVIYGMATFLLEKTTIVSVNEIVAGYMFGGVSIQVGVAMGAVSVSTVDKMYEAVFWDSEVLDGYIETLNINGHSYNGSGSSTANVTLKTINGQDIVGEGDISVGSVEVSFNLGKPNNTGVFGNVDSTTQNNIKAIIDTKTIILIKLESENGSIKAYGNALYQESNADGQTVKGIALQEGGNNLFAFTNDGTVNYIAANENIVAVAPNENYILTLITL